MQAWVFKTWVKAASHSTGDVAAAIDDTYAYVTPKLPIPYKIFIIEVNVSASDTRGFIFLKEADGKWVELDHINGVDKAAFVTKVLQAGLPSSPDVPGALAPNLPLPKPPK